MDSDTQPIAVSLAIVFLGFVLFGIWRRRENLVYNLRKLIIAFVVGGVVYYLFLQAPELQAAAPFTALIVTVLLYRARRARKRGIRASTRRRAIAKWELKTGKKFDTRYHEIGHIVPFSKGGSDTEDNLQVEEKSENRSKGAKSPWWDVMSWLR